MESHIEQPLSIILINIQRCICYKWKLLHCLQHYIQIWKHLIWVAKYSFVKLGLNFIYIQKFFHYSQIKASTSEIDLSHFKKVFMRTSRKWSWTQITNKNFHLLKVEFRFMVHGDVNWGNFNLSQRLTRIRVNHKTDWILEHFLLKVCVGSFLLMFTSQYQEKFRKAVFAKPPKYSVAYFPWSNKYLLNLKLFLEQ